MGKKKKKKNQKKEVTLSSIYLFDDLEKKSKKKMKKEFKKALDEIEAYQMMLLEVDKKYSSNKKSKKEINKKEKDLYESMDAIKYRQKLSKKWEKKGFFDTILDLLVEASPYVTLIAKAFCMLIVTFLGIDGVKSKINPNMLRKIARVYDIALHV